MNEQKALKSALLLSRALVSQMEDVEFDANAQGCQVSDDGYGLEYEGEALHLVDLTGGALILLRGLMLDLAELCDLHPAEIARTTELNVAMNEAIGAVEAQVRESEAQTRYFWN